MFMSASRAKRSRQTARTISKCQGFLLRIHDVEVMLGAYLAETAFSTDSADCAAHAAWCDQSAGIDDIRPQPRLNGAVSAD